MTKLRRGFVAFLVGAIAVGVAYVYFDGARSAQPAKPEKATAADVPPTKTTSQAPVVQPMAKPDSLPAAVTRRNALAAKFETATDLASFVDDLSGAVASGDGEAAHWTAMAYEDCFAFSVRPEAASLFRAQARAMAEPARSMALTHADNVERRCKNLIAREKIRSAKVFGLHAQARQGGDLAELAADLEKPAPDETAAQVKDTLRRIVSSRDAEAIGAIAQAMGTDHSDLQPAFGPFAGGQSHLVAWQLVACTLGQDCSPTGRVMRNLCVTSSQCFAGSYQELMQQAYATPVEFARALQEQRTLLDLINRNAMDELFP